VNVRVGLARGPLSYDDAADVDRCVREALGALALPADFIRPGDHVVLKPNWVKEHDERRPGNNSWEHIVTHPAVIEAVIRWVAPQLRGSGSIVVCDAPQTDSSFEAIRLYCRLDDMVGRCQRDHAGTRIELLDLRPEEWHALDGVTVSRTVLPGDPLGATEVALGPDSEFVGYHGCGRLYGASYDVAETNEHHHGQRHDYLLCRTPMDADVLINLPKLKTHKKVGLTCSLKNLVGINANKNWLPHHTEGTPDQGGDQFATATRKAHFEQRAMATIKAQLRHRPGASRFFVPVKKLGRLVFGDTQKVIRSGNWHGNDTCWRMVLDLNKCLFFYDGSGRRRSTPLRYLAVVDGIVGGDGNGPMAADPKPCGVIVAGLNPVAVDCVAATIMGFDWAKIPMLRRAFELRGLDFTAFAPEDVLVVSPEAGWSGRLGEIEPTFEFRPHFGWVGAIEAQRPAVLR